MIGAKGTPIGIPIDLVSVQRRTFIKSPEIIPKNPAIAPRKIYAKRSILADRPR